VAEAFGAWSNANRVRAAIVLANLQRGALDHAERELKLTTQIGWDAGDLSMFDTAVRAEIALGRGDADTGLRLWRAAAAAPRDPRRQGPGGDLSSLEPWRRRFRPSPWSPTRSTAGSPWSRGSPMRCPPRCQR
jgi:hypothetical protein